MAKAMQSRVEMCFCQGFCLRSFPHADDFTDHAIIMNGTKIGLGVLRLLRARMAERPRFVRAFLISSISVQVLALGVSFDFVTWNRCAQEVALALPKPSFRH